MSKLSFVFCSIGVLLGACDGEPTPAVESFDDTQARVDAPWTHPSPDGLPSVAAESYLEAGRYLSVTALCNDCHTHGWLPDADVVEEQWLAGSPVGYEGPWGVSFPSNLRLLAHEWSEDQWVEKLRRRRAHRHVPWMAITVLSDKDARALYRFLQHLGPHGEPMPELIPPGEPSGRPYVSLRRWPAGTSLRAVEID